MSRVLIAGCGDVGGELARRLLADGLEVYGLRRRVYLLPAGVRPIAADLLITDGGRTRTVDAAKGGPALRRWVRNRSRCGATRRAPANRLDDGVADDFASTSVSASGSSITRSSSAPLRSR